MTDLINLMHKSLRELPRPTMHGRVLEVVGTIIKAVVPQAKIGEICTLRSIHEQKQTLAEVVGFSKEAALLTPIGEIQGLSFATEVIPSGKVHNVPVSQELLGRVINGFGQPIDDGPPIKAESYYPVYAAPPNPMTRRPVKQTLVLGIRPIDGILSCGIGQRIGIFSAAGVGKSSLIACLAKSADVDMTVLALIGERGREVREFVEYNLGPEGMPKSVVVVATSDRPATERMKAAYVATAIAEFFRDKGKNVLLLMDSVTRFARALREIGLAVGEPPTRRGFPPSVFANLPKLMERAGNSEKGSITAFYTILVEGDDMTEPVADETRSILDGHIILSRNLSEKKHFPAIDIQASVSRVMPYITSTKHQADAAHIRKLLAKYNEVDLLLKIGEYKEGNDPVTDEAVKKIEMINQFLQQDLNEKQSFDLTLQQMENITF